LREDAVLLFFLAGLHGVILDDTLVIEKHYEFLL
jgi:hypothetical protein